MRQTSASDVGVKLALRNALESEAEFVEAEDADAQILALLRKSSHAHRFLQSRIRMSR